MKRIISVFIALTMLLTMTACGVQNDQNEGTLVGKWETEVDYAGVVNAFVSENEVLSVSGATLESAPVKVTYTFSEDGTASCVLDQNQLYEGLSVMFEEILTPVIAALGNMTLEEYMASTKMSQDELIVSLFTEELLTAMKNAVGFTGTYRLNGDKLIVTVNDNTSQAKVALNGDTLTLTSPIGTTTGSEVQKAAVKALFPLTLTKAS